MSKRHKSEVAASPAEEKKCYTPRFLRAMLFATSHHRLQRRKSSESPAYIEHPVRVATVLQECGVDDEDIIIAALLHDTVEDTDATLEDIQEQFGHNVADIVQGCTDDKSLPKAQRKLLQIEKVRDGPAGVKLVKLSDKLDNCQEIWSAPPVGWSRERAMGYALWSSVVCEQARGLNVELDRRLDALFASIRENYAEHINESRASIPVANILALANLQNLGREVATMDYKHPVRRGFNQVERDVKDIIALNQLKVDDDAILEAYYASMA